MKRYLNWNGETIDKLDSKDFPTRRAFYAELGYLSNEYALAGMLGHWSQRACKGWNT